jgi:uncharacterized protein (DUF1697 family)
MTSTYIVLLRAVNVGGVGSLPAKDFVQVLEKLRLSGVTTYIQSGNALFRASRKDAARLPQRIRAAISRKLGFAPEVILLRQDDLESALAANPYPEAASEPQALHLTFLAAAPRAPDLAALDQLRKDNERFALKGRVFYLHAPDGVGKSKLAARIERALGVAGTARNWRTACKLAELAREISGERPGPTAGRSS